MHGAGSSGPKTKAGKERSRLAVLKHGGFSQKAMEVHREAMMLIRQSKDLLQSFSESN